MYSISPRMSNNYSSNCELNNLIESIDKKILDIATCEYNNIRFGFNKVIDYNKYEDLLIMKEILLDKLLGCNCLDDKFLININFNIKKLINS